MSFLNKYRGALGLENEDLEKEVDTEQEEQVEEQSEETTENVEDQTEEQVEEQVEESTDEESKEESEEESEEEQETLVPVEPEETTEEAIQLDDSEAPAAGGSRLQAYRDAAGLVETDETVTEKETVKTTEEVEENTEETSEEESEEKADEEEEKKSAEDSEEEKEASSDEEGEAKEEGDESEESKENEESDESVKALEALRDEIMVSYQRGGMTEGEASMVNVAVNNILARNGLQAERVVPSIESFSENSTRRRLATSTTADMINRIISKIKK